MFKYIDLFFDENDQLLDRVYSAIIDDSNYTYVVRVISPALATEAVDVTISTPNEQRISKTIRTKLYQDGDGNYLKGSDVADSRKDYYQQVSDYNVWFREINGTVYNVLTKLNARKIGISVTFSTLVNDPNAITYLGTFGSDNDTYNDLPISYTGNIGDYLRCNVLSYTSISTGLEFSFMDIVYYNGTSWIKGEQFVPRQSTNITYLTVTPSFVLEYDDIEPTFTETIVNDLASLNGTVSDLLNQVYELEEVLFFDTFNDFPSIGYSNKLYISLDDQKVYRWLNTQYLELDFVTTVEQIYRESDSETLTNILDAKADITGDTFTGDITAPNINVTDTIYAAVFKDADNNLYYIDPSNTGTSIEVAGSANIDGDLHVTGDLIINGDTTTLNSTTITVDDKNIELGSIDTPTDTTADGGGITLKGDTDKTIIWQNLTDSWNFNQNIISSGYIKGNQLQSTVATGTSPLTVTSTTKVSNLNVDLLDDQSGDYYLNYSNFTNTPDINDSTITISAGSGLSTGGYFTLNQDTGKVITLEHGDTSSQNSLDALTGKTVISDVDVDQYGHVTSLNTRDIELTDFGVNATAEELNYVNGVTSNIQNQLNNKLGSTEQAVDSDKLDNQDGTYYLDYNNFTNKPTIGDGIITIDSGSGLSGTDTFTTNQTTNKTITLSHADTSTQSSVDNSNGNVIQDVTLDTYGHVTSLGSYDLDNRYYTETELNNGQLDNRYYTESEIDTILLSYNNIYRYSTYADLPASGDINDTYVVLNDETSDGNLSVYLWNGSIYINASNTLSAAEIKSLYESNLNTNVYTDAEKTKLAGIEDGAQVNTVDTVNGYTGTVILNTDDINEGSTNLYYTEARVSANSDVSANTLHRTSNGTDHTYIDQDVTSTGNPQFNSIDLNTTSKPSYESGRIFFDTLKGEYTGYLPDSSEVEINFGFEELVSVVNNTGSTIYNGTLVYATTSCECPDGKLRADIGLADARFKDKSDQIGMITADILAGGYGYATRSGLVGGLDTSSYSDGDKLYLSTNGNYSTTRPDDGSFPIKIGTVALSDPTNGAIYIYINHSELTADMTNQNGFPSTQRFNTTLSVNDSTRTFTINPISDYHYYQDATKYEESLNKSVVFSNTDGLHVIYFDNGVLTSNDNPTQTEIENLILYDTWVAGVIWDSDNLRTEAVLDERHGLMDPVVHLWAHQSIGTLYISGAGLNIPNIDDSSPTDASVEFSITQGRIKDEDLDQTITEKDITDNIREYYFIGTNGYYRRNSENQYGLSVGLNGRLQYNYFDGSTWSIVEATSGDYLFRHILAIPEVDKTRTNYISVMGNNEYASINDAESNVLYEKELIESYLPQSEYVYCYSILYQTKDSYTGTYNARIVSLNDGSSAFDFRESSGTSGTTANVTSHAVLSDRDLPDSHPADAISYDNTISALTSINVQDAIDEVEGRLDTAESNISTLDSTKADITYVDTELALKADITYVDTSISNLIDSSPATLDTLNELAAALGDDPNFATTVTTLIGNNTSDISDIQANYVTTDTIQSISAQKNFNGPVYFNDNIYWKPLKNIELTQTANDDEWSFDIHRNGYTGGYWHVWDSDLGSLLKVYAENGNVEVYGTISEGGTLLSGKYLGLTATATNSDKLDNQHGIYYLDWTNFTNTPTTIDGYGITDAVYNTTTVNGYALSSNVSLTYTDVNAAPTSHTQAWSTITSTPTTISGYGITDAYTKTETDSNISTAISNLIDSSPTTLDTLNELAAALGDDPNFATTVTNSIATKLSLSGGTLTGDLLLNDGTSISPEIKFYNDTYAAGIDLYNSSKTLRFIDRTLNVSRIEFNLNDGSIQANGNINTIGNITQNGTQVSLNGHTHTLSNITDITATAAEVNKLAGVTTTTTELNYVNGVTSSIQTQLNNKLGLTQKAADSDKLDGNDSLYYLDYNNLTNKPTIGDGTITISAGSGLSTGGSFTTNQTGNSTITLSHADTSSQSSVIGLTGTNVISTIQLDTYGHITLLSTKGISLGDFGLTSSPTELNYTDGVTSNIQTQLNTKSPIDNPIFTGIVTAPTINTTSKLNVDLIGAYGGDDLGIGAGETTTYMSGNITGEYLYLGGESGIKIVSSPDNWSSGWAGRNEATLVDINGDTTLPGNLNISGNMVIDGTLTVSGGTTTINTETINLADNIILLNSNETGTPSQNAGIEIERGTLANVDLYWKEASDDWYLNTDGSTERLIYHSGNLSVNNPTITFSAGDGLSGGGTLTLNQSSNSTITFSHSDTSSQSSLTALTGAYVVSDINLDTYGHTTSISTRQLTLSDLGYTGDPDADKYDHWSFTASDTQNINSGDTVTLIGSGSTSIVNTGKTITIYSTDTDTTYTAGSGLSLSSQVFSHADTSTQPTVSSLSNAVVFSSIYLDEFGHVTALGTRSLLLTGFGITSTASELNILDGATLTTTELNYVDGVTSSIQTQLNNKLGSTSQAVDSDKLDGQHGSYYLDYNNLTNKPASSADPEWSYIYSTQVTTAVVSLYNIFDFTSYDYKVVIKIETSTYDTSQPYIDLTNGTSQYFNSVYSYINSGNYSSSLTNAAQGATYFTLSRASYYIPITAPLSSGYSTDWTVLQSELILTPSVKSSLSGGVDLDFGVNVQGSSIIYQTNQANGPGSSGSYVALAQTDVSGSCVPLSSVNLDGIYISNNLTDGASDFVTVVVYRRPNKF